MIQFTIAQFMNDNNFIIENDASTITSQQAWCNVFKEEQEQEVKYGTISQLLAKIAEKVLNVDKELRSDQVKRSIIAQDDKLIMRKF
nr:7571_t:CDS:2 [Entrophospora candida]